MTTAMTSKQEGLGGRPGTFAPDDVSTVVGPAPSPEVFEEPGEGSRGFEGLERYGRYILLEKIGRGGMAEVWKAMSTGAEGFRRLSVVKRVRPDRVADTYYVKSFCDEARVSALLNHPNLVHVHEFGELAGTHFLAMEYLNGRDLGAVLRVLRQRKERLPVPVAVFVALEVAHGLSYAHSLTDGTGRSLNLVHRDVSPDNIMLLHTGGVKLLDFGVARANDPLRACITHGRVLKGKTSYMSPEQILSRKLDGRSDVFALGVVLWEMLAGHTLFKSADDFETMRLVLKRTIAAPSSVTPGIPPELDAICALALARNPNERYAGADRLAHDLEELLRTMPFRRSDVPDLMRKLFGASSGEMSAVSRVALPDEGLGAEVSRRSLPALRGWVARGPAAAAVSRVRSLTKSAAPFMLAGGIAVAAVAGFMAPRGSGLAPPGAAPAATPRSPVSPPRPPAATPAPPPVAPVITPPPAALPLVTSADVVIHRAPPPRPRPARPTLVSVTRPAPPPRPAAARAAKTARNELPELHVDPFTE